jgi:two-component system nitrogen regulation sensor histidine kinase NtrY
MGEIAFLDRPGGGTHVRISFDTAKLAALASGDGSPEGNKDDEVEDS